MPKLLDMVRAAHLKALVTVEAKDDPVLVSLVRGEENTRASRLAVDMGLEWPTTSAEVERWKMGRKTQYLADWAAQPFQGQGVRCFGTYTFSKSISWFQIIMLIIWLWCLLNTVLAAGQEIDIMKMRSNVFPVRTSLARAEEVGADVTCRRCRSKPETLGHVLGECPAGRGARIKRHDDLVDRIQKHAEDKGWIFAREQLLEGDDRPLRPDLVILTPGKAIVIDVTVRFEQDNSLREAAEEKTTKYHAILDSVKHDMGVDDAEVMPIVFGSRGANCQVGAQT